MLPFQEQIIADLLDDPNGGLIVLSSGLPIHSLVASLLLLHHPSQGSLLILSASDSQKSSISRSLLPLLQNPNPNPNPNPILPTDIPGDVLSHHRTALYASGASYFVTPRILIADLLTSRVPPSSIAGLLILNAHRLTDTSTETFIARIMRSLSRTAYVRALTDRPHAMVSGFAKAERIMKCLYVRRLHLWPRFHVLVSGDLEQTPPEVVDVRVPMTPAMRGIQQAVLETMDACLKELRRTNKVDVDDLTVENGLFKSFDEVVRRQLDPIWHTLGKKTKQLVSDLRTLRKLLDYLVRYDAVTYLKYLDTLRVSEGVRSVWIFAESSYKIFELAKKRVYQVLRADGVRISADRKSSAGKRRRANENSSIKEMENGGLQLDNSSSLSNKMDSVKMEANVGVVLEEVLEEAPKWKVLRELLEEIEVERRKEASPKEGKDFVEDGGYNNDIVLVVCKDERSCLQLEDCIIKNSHQVMRQEWEKYLFGKAELHSLQKRNKKRSQDPKGYGVLDGAVTSGSCENSDPSTISKLENDALLAAASEMSHIAKEKSVVRDESQPLAGRRGSGKGRGRGRSQKATMKARDSRNNLKKSADQTVKTSSEVAEPEAKAGVQENDLIASCIGNIDKGFLQMHAHDSVGSESSDARPIPPVQFYALEKDEHILDIWKPSVIIVFHPDMTFVREIEVYKAENPSIKLKVYFLFYENSTEVQKFEASIRRENGAFESLIRQKSLLMIPVDQV